MTEAKRIAETRINGECGTCHRRVTRILDSEFPTCRTNGERFVYSHVIDEGWGIFACKCAAQIDESWIPLRAAGISEQGDREDGQA